MSNKAVLPALVGLAISCIFGFSFMFTADALTLVEPLQLLGYRFGVAAVAMTLALKLLRIPLNYQGKPVKALFWLALFQPVLYFVCETIGVKLTSSSEAGMMIAIIPVVVAAFAAIFLGERPTLMQWVCIFVSVVGVFVIVSGTAGGGSRGLGLLALAGAVLAAGIYQILSRRSSVHFQPVEITFVMMWFGAVVFNLLSVGKMLWAGQMGQYWQGLTQPAVLQAVLYLGVLSSVVAFLLMNFNLSKLPASQAAVFSNLTTVVSIVAGVVLRHEPFSQAQGLGAMAILVGVFGTNYFAKSANETKPGSAASIECDQ